MRRPTLLAAASLCTLASCQSSRVTAWGDADSPHIEAAMAPEAPADTTASRSAQDPFASTANDPFASGGEDGVLSHRAPAGLQYAAYGSLPRTHLAAFTSPDTAGSGENLRRVSFSDQGADFDPCVSPDGKLIYFASTRNRPTADLFVKSIDGTAITQLTSDPAQDVMPAVSPDGKRIAFCSNRTGTWDIYVMNSTGCAAGEPAVQVTSDAGNELHPTWSPDGKWIAFCRQSEPSARWEIWLTDAERPGVMKFLTFGMFPSWQPNGAKIAFQRPRERGERLFSIWTIDVSSGEAVNPTEVISSATAAAINPTWSPDGSTIAFSVITADAARANAERPSHSDVWMVKADGSGRANLTGGEGVNLSPAWSADNHVYFVSSRGGTDNIWSIGAASTLTALKSQPETAAPAHPLEPAAQPRPAATAMTSPAPEQPTSSNSAGSEGGEEAKPVATAPEKPEAEPQQ